MNIHNLQTGDKLTGLYYGTIFSGTVVQSGAVISVVLNKPIHLFGIDRYYIKFNIPWRGEIYAVDLWSHEQGHNFYMADRFEKVEVNPAYAIRLCHEMQEQSTERSAVMDDLKITKIDKHLREIEIRDACQTLIDLYTEWLSV